MDGYNSYDEINASGFFFNDTATTEIYTLSLHDALPISIPLVALPVAAYLTARDKVALQEGTWAISADSSTGLKVRSEEHTSELQSHVNLVCRLLLEKKTESSLVTRHSINTESQSLSLSF